MIYRVVAESGEELFRVAGARAGEHGPPGVDELRLLLPPGVSVESVSVEAVEPAETGEASTVGVERAREPHAPGRSPCASSAEDACRLLTTMLGDDLSADAAVDAVDDRARVDVFFDAGETDGGAEHGRTHDRGTEERGRPAGHTRQDDGHRGDDATAKCTCRIDAVVLLDPADAEYKATPKKDAQDKPLDSDAYSAHGADVEVEALTPAIDGKNKSRDRPKVGTESVALIHRNPCPDCDGKARLHMWAKTRANVEATAWPKVGRDAWASAEVGTVARGNLKYDVAAAVSVKEKQDSGLEIEVDVPLPGGGSVKQTYKPKLAESGFKRDESGGENRRTIVGNKMEVMIGTKARATANSQGAASAAAAAVSHSHVAWYGICNCVRHATPRKPTWGVRTGDENVGRTLAKQLADLADSGDVTPPEDPPQPKLPPKPVEPPQPPDRPRAAATTRSDRSSGYRTRGGSRCRARTWIPSCRGRGRSRGRRRSRRCSRSSSACASCARRASSSGARRRSRRRSATSSARRPPA